MVKVWQSTDLLVVVFVIFLLSLQVVIGAYRWRAVMAALKASVSFFKAFINVYIGFFFNHALPSSVGGDVVRIYLARKLEISTRISVNSIVIERIGTVFGLLLLLVILSPFMEISKNALIPKEGIFFAAIVGVVILVLMVFVSVFKDQLPKGYAFDWLRYVCQDFAIVLSDKANLLKVVFWSLLGHLNVAVAVYLSALALNINQQSDFSLFEFIILVPPVFLITAIPISIAGWGVREGAMITALGFVGISAEAALIISITFGVADLISSVPGGLFWLLDKTGDMKQLKEMEDFKL